MLATIQFMAITSHHFRDWPSPPTNLPPPRRSHIQVRQASNLVPNLGHYKRKAKKNADPDKYKYSGYGIVFDSHESSSLSNGSGFGKNGLIFGADMSSAVHIDNKKKDILILVKCPTNSLGDTTLTAEKEYAINFTEQQKKFCLSLYYNGVNNYIFINDVDIHKFKAKDFEINAAPLCFGNVSKDFSTILWNACEQLCLYLVSISDTCISSNKIKFLKTIHRKQLFSFISFKSTLMQIIKSPYIFFVI